MNECQLLHKLDCSGENVLHPSTISVQCVFGKYYLTTFTYHDNNNYFHYKEYLKLKCQRHLFRELVKLIYPRPNPSFPCLAD